ncbi:uncharacterized protein B0H18DRAFT_1217493 [Fomitopsis serialis]|uniref:uncharacterized protein n=1 Tax=Fomitopsis serialis TaxID=139415 RepID=UPI0020085E5F|nr:uncharacterized protein B0H18DRAFT_1217493 [Neoantrodia serialis]KAH9911944.1 hypothetical protein B0H18DRAFT_1217493 [Neoantrodia serialis]
MISPERNPWRHTLLSCPLVCRDWHHYPLFYLREYAELRDRQQVIALSNHLRAKSRLGGAVKRVTIFGGSDPDVAKPVPQLGTFTPMLARKLPNSEVLQIRHAELALGAVPLASMRRLTAFPSLTVLELTSVHFSSPSQLVQLLSAIPTLRSLISRRVFCKSTWSHTSVLPLHITHLRRMGVWHDHAPAMMSLLTRLVRAAQVEDLEIGVDGCTTSLGGGQRWHQLVDSTAPSLKVFRLVCDTNGMPVAAFTNMVQSARLHWHLNLEHLSLKSLVVRNADHWWMLRVLSTVQSAAIRTVSICFTVGADTAAQVRALLTEFNRNNYLKILDGTLSGSTFASIPPTGVCLTISIPAYAVPDSKLGIHLGAGHGTK